MTPVAAPAIWPALNEPDYKFKKETGEWHVRLRLDTEALAAFQPVIDAAIELRDEAFEAKKDELTRQKKGALLKELNVADVIKPEIDPETGEETGNYIFRAALSYKVEIKNGPKTGEVFYKKPDLFDAKGKTLKNPPRIGSGSLLKLAVVPMDYWMPKDKTIGVRFELAAVQVIKLVSGGQRSAADYGFGEEDGDEIEDQPMTGGFSDETGGASEDEGGDF
jgi:hypothetical protein